MTDMRQAVQDNLLSFNSRFEGSCTWMYLDVKGLVTTGVGDLIDSPGAALALDWAHVDGTPASVPEVQAAWAQVKGAQALRMLGGGHFAQLTSIRLTPAGLLKAVSSRRDLDWAHLLARFPNLPTWPADAQMGVLSIAWAAGAAWRAPHFDLAAVHPFCAPAAAEDYIGMAREGWLNEDAGGVHNAGLHPRNLANQTLFMNADRVVNGRGYDPESFYYPQTLT